MKDNFDVAGHKGAFFRSSWTARVLYDCPTESVVHHTTRSTSCLSALDFCFVGSLLKSCIIIELFLGPTPISTFKGIPAVVMPERHHSLAALFLLQATQLTNP